MLNYSKGHHCTQIKKKTHSRKENLRQIYTMYINAKVLYTFIKICNHDEERVILAVPGWDIIINSKHETHPVIGI